MSINLGLTRVLKLLEHLGNPHERLKVLHIAGTNGKGSVCSYLSSLLQGTSNQVGKFTTPHLIQVTDSITINNTPISLDAYQKIRKNLNLINSKHGLDCTEFELLTCTAFKYFHDLKCEWCVVEVGLGGRLDATNVIPGHCKAACGITKISIDHEAFLGSTLPQIAREKAGIITPGAKYAVVDGSNEESVIQVIRERCGDIGCQLKITDPSIGNNLIETKSWGRIVLDKLPLNGAYQICNLRVALSIFDNIQQHHNSNLTKDAVVKRLNSVRWPGRLQKLNFCYDSIHKSTMPILLDGAHNGSAAIELARFLRAEYGEQPVTFVMAVTHGKDLGPLLGTLLREQDRVLVTGYGEVEGMPWVHAMDLEELSTYIKQNFTKNVRMQEQPGTILSSLATEQVVDHTPVVVCGSLYLCGKVLRLHQDNARS